VTATAIRPATADPVPAARRWWVRLIVAGLLLLVVLAGVAYALLSTQLAAVKTVHVVGTTQVPAAAVSQAAAVQVGTPLLRLDVAAIRRRVLAALPAVGSVSVHRSWPSTVAISVQERLVAAVVPHDGQFLLLDRHGVAYRLTRAAPAGAPVAALTNPGPDDPSTRAVLAVLAGLPADLRRLTVRVAAPTPDRVTLTLRAGREVLWGDAADGPAKAAVVRILLHRKGQHIDVSAPALVTVH